MKRFILILSLFTVFAVHADDNRIHMGFSLKPHIEFHDDCRITMRHNDVYIVNDAMHDERIVITDHNELIINGIPYETDTLQSALTRQYYHLTKQCLDGAKKIGKEGAKMGWEGAKIGIKAVTGVFKLILPSYDSEDLERDMERESEKIEAKADILEEKADLLDERLDELEDVHYDLKDAVDALEALHWF